MMSREQAINFTINDVWVTYASHAFKGVDVQEAQYMQAKVCFFTGWISALDCMRETLANSGLSEDEGAQKIEDLYNEATGFILKVAQANKQT